MTYVSKKEKVFDLPDQEETSSVSLKNTDTRLIGFPSISDGRAWTTDDHQRYQHHLLSGSETNLPKSSSNFKYIPFDVLLGILMAEKDAYIQELLERQEEKSSSGGKLYRAEGYEDSDDDRDALIRKDAEVVALKNKIAGLESELEDYQDTLTKAMHKLENMDAILGENNSLRERIKYLEESIKSLQDEKREVELELWNLRRSSESDSEIDDKNGQRWPIKNPSQDEYVQQEIARLSAERDAFKSQLDQLQKHLQRANNDAAELQILRKLSETTSNTLQQVTNENDSYKKKLQAMKYLQNHTEDLKKQAQALTEKYKRESQRANDQLKQIDATARELHLLREERDTLQRRVQELASYETQYFSLQSKLHQVDAILDENDMLNKKLLQLDNLEMENDHLRAQIHHLQGAQEQAAADKEKIIRLQCAVVDQEEEMRRMLRQIEQLSDGYTTNAEIHHLRTELEEKDSKLKQFERQVTEIPILESEIEQLKTKLHKCIDDFKTDKQLLIRLQEELETCRNRCQELEEEAPPCTAEEEPMTRLTNYQADEGRIFQYREGSRAGIVTEEVECQSEEIKFVEKGTEADFEKTESGMESGEEAEELKEGKQSLKVEVVGCKISETTIDDFIKEIEEMKELVKAKEERIVLLEAEINRVKNDFRDKKNWEMKKIMENSEDLEHEIEKVREIKEKVMVDVEMHQDAVRRATELEKVLTMERKARAFAVNLVVDLERELAEEKRRHEVKTKVSKLEKEEANLVRQEMYEKMVTEDRSIKALKNLFQKVIDELKAENQVLREINEYSQKVEVAGLKSVAKKLRAKVKLMKSLSKPELQADYKSVQEKVKILLRETNNLVNEITHLKTALDSEKKTKDYLEKELIGLQAEVATCLTAGSKVFDQELAARDVLIVELKKELTVVRNDLEDSVKEIQVLRKEYSNLLSSCNNLKSEKQSLKGEVAQLLAQIEEQKSLESEINKLSDQIEKQKKVEIEFAKFTASIRQERPEKPGICTRDDHGDIEQQMYQMSTTIEDQNNRIADHENKEKEYLSEIIVLKRSLENSRTEMIELGVLEDELKHDLKRKEEEVRNLMEANLSLTREVEEKRLQIEASDTEKVEETHVDLEESRALEEAMRKIDHKLDELKRRLGDYKKMEDEMDGLRRKRDAVLDQMAFFHSEMEELKKKLNELEDLRTELEETKAEKNEQLKKASENLSALLEELQQTRTQVESLKAENENLQNELTKAENMLEVSKKLHKTASQMQTLPPSAEFFTPPALPSPRSSSHVESEREIEDLVPGHTHRKELLDLENHYSTEINNLKEAHLKKLKKLAAHHEKDVISRTRAYNENINNIKSNYESGIRKLVEKHKASIGKLQQLHEEEIEELHKNYETQMVAMEKQNEDLIGDVRAKAAENSKKMAEDHNRDLREMQARYDCMIKEKEAQVQAEIANAESTVSQSAAEIHQAHKVTVDNLTQFYQSSILELEEKHGKELKKCKKDHLKKIELMKNKYDDLLLEERKKYEEQLEAMLHQLKKGQRGSGSIDGVLKNFLQKSNPPANPRLEFIEVLQKIINEGLESLTFEELILVHGKTCFIPETITGHDERGGGELNESSLEGCRHKALMAAEREDLLRKIFTLEQEIVIKQLETHEAIINMEAAEKYRIQELKSALCNAQQKNFELKRHLSIQSKFEMDMKIEKCMLDKHPTINETNVQEKVKELEKEKAERKRVEDELQRERANVKNLTAVLEAEKERFRSQRKKDSDYVESIRLRLEEAVNHEQMMESQLDNEARFRAKLESELQSLQKSFNLIADAASIPVMDAKVTPDCGLVTNSMPFTDADIAHMITSLSFQTVKDFKNFDQCESTKKNSIHGRSRSRHKKVPKSVHNL